MPTFIIVSENDSPELSSKIKAQYPDDHYVLRPNSQWLVDVEKTTKDVADELIDDKTGAAVVFLASNHWGRFRKDLWEWLELD